MGGITREALAIPLRSHSTMNQGCLSSRYALQSLVYLAKASRAGFVVIEEMARQENLPPSFLAKILRRLVKKGFLRVRRGPNGGYALARDPREIRAVDVFDALGNPDEKKMCVLGARSCSSQLACPIHSTVERADQALRDGLRQLTLAGLAGI